MCYEMKLDLPRLLNERLQSGGFRYRVRAEGNKYKRIKLNVSPNHADFLEHYRAARRGISLQPETPPEDRVILGPLIGS